MTKDREMLEAWHEHLYRNASEDLWGSSLGWRAFYEEWMAFKRDWEEGRHD